MTVAAVISLAAIDDGAITSLVHCATGDGFRRTAVDGRPFTVQYFGQPYYGTADNLVDLHVKMYGGYERHVLDAMGEVLEMSDPAGRTVAIDVGANVGTHTIFLANRVDVVHAIEPWPPVLDRLVEHVEGLSNVVIHPVGLAAEPGTLPFRVPPAQNLAWGSFSETFASGKYGEGEVVQLPLVVADEYLAGRGVKGVDLIKIDVEGYEKPALQGFRRTLIRNRPVVFFELNVSPEEGFHSRTELLQTFPEDYEFFEIRSPRALAWRVGDQLVACAPDDHELVRFNMRFDEDGRNLLAVPAGFLDL